MTEKRAAVVIYGGLSKASEDDDEQYGDTSIGSQVAAVKRKLREVYREDGFDIIGPGTDRDWFEDDGFSGSKRNRGPGLEAAIQAALRAADERGGCEIWANTSARFGRGSGKLGEARAIGKLFYDLRERGVALRSVADDHLVSMEELVGIGSSFAAKYASDLGESIKRAKQRELKKGQHIGGPVCDGYWVQRWFDEDGKPQRKFLTDPDRLPIVRSIFDLADEGVPDTTIARKLNAQGTRTRHGRPFTRRAIQNTVTNPFYAGRIAYKRGTPDEQIVRGHHPPLVKPAVFDRIQKARVARDYASPEQRVVGRPARNHALARLAVCGRCGQRLYARSSSYRRKDGSRARFYACHSYVESSGTCDAKPIDAEVVDAAVIAGLDTLLVDFDAWRRRIEDGHTAERDRLASEVDRAQHDHDAQANKATKVEAKWSEYTAKDSTKADLVLPMVERERQSLAEAERRLQATQDALAAVPTEAPADAMLDFANAVQEAISGRLDKTGTMAEVNQALLELFECFKIREEPGDGLFHGILIEPWLRVGAVPPPTDPELGWAWPKLISPDSKAPPLRCLQPEPKPEQNVLNSQE